MSQKPPKDYLGDGAYAEADDFGGVILTAEDGVRATDRVVLEPEVLAAFERYVARMRVAQDLANPPEVSSEELLEHVEKGVALERMAAALEVIERFGGIEGDHHRAWVIDQVLRELVGDHYEEWVRRFKAGEDGPETYSWEEGVAP